MRTGYCIAHAPESQQWRSRGGTHSRTSERAARLLPARLRPVADLLERAVMECYRGELPERRLVALAAGARALVAVIQAGEVEERVRELERHVADMVQQQPPHRW